jgi:hypothetical protein
VGEAISTQIFRFTLCINEGDTGDVIITADVKEIPLPSYRVIKEVQ